MWNINATFIHNYIQFNFNRLIPTKFIPRVRPILLRLCLQFPCHQDSRSNKLLLSFTPLFFARISRLMCFDVLNTLSLLTPNNQANLNNQCDEEEVAVNLSKGAPNASRVWKRQLNCWCITIIPGIALCVILRFDWMNKITHITPGWWWYYRLCTKQRNHPNAGAK